MNYKSLTTRINEGFANEASDWGTREITDDNLLINAVIKASKKSVEFAKSIIQSLKDGKAIEFTNEASDWGTREITDGNLLIKAVVKAAKGSKSLTKKILSELKALNLKGVTVTEAKDKTLADFNPKTIKAVKAKYDHNGMMRNNSKVIDLILSVDKSMDKSEAEDLLGVLLTESENDEDEVKESKKGRKKSKKNESDDEDEVDESDDEDEVKESKKGRKKSKKNESDDEDEVDESDDEDEVNESKKMKFVKKFESEDESDELDEDESEDGEDHIKESKKSRKKSKKNESDDEDEDEFIGENKIDAKDAVRGDMGRVKKLNKGGVIFNIDGDKFELKFVDGSKKTFDKSELEFYLVESEEEEITECEFSDDDLYEAIDDFSDEQELTKESKRKLRKKAFENFDKIVDEDRASRKKNFTNGKKKANSFVKSLFTGSHY